jgi:hypothetical protein
MTTPPPVAFLGRLQLTDANGTPCPGARLCISGKVEGGRGGATEMMTLYADAARTIPLPNPVMAVHYRSEDADAAGAAHIRQRRQD